MPSCSCSNCCVAFISAASSAHEIDLKEPAYITDRILKLHPNQENILPLPYHEMALKKIRATKEKVLEIRIYRPEVQWGHFVALIGIDEKQYGQSFEVGTAGGAASCLLSLFIAFTSKKTAKATIRKVMTVLRNTP